MKRLKLLAVVGGVMAVALVMPAYRLTHRALTVIDGTLRAQGLERRAEIIPDPWGVPFRLRNADGIGLAADSIWPSFAPRFVPTCSTAAASSATAPTSVPSSHGALSGREKPGA